MARPDVTALGAGHMIEEYAVITGTPTCCGNASREGGRVGHDAVRNTDCVDFADVRHGIDADPGGAAAARGGAHARRYLLALLPFLSWASRTR